MIVLIDVSEWIGFQQRSQINLHRRQTKMKDEKQRNTFVTLKSALKKATLSAVLAGGLLIPTAQAAEISASRQPLDQRVKIVSEALRKKLSENQNALDPTQAENSTSSDELLAQWGNWRNVWYNWNNAWYNWANWAN